MQRHSKKRGLYRCMYYNFLARHRQTKTEVKISYYQFIDWWLNTGHIMERGVHNHEYCMSRIDRNKGYTLQNIECITNYENNRKLRKK